MRNDREMIGFSAMARYFGVVKDNRVEIEGGARLRDGAHVEIVPLAPELEPSKSDEDRAERALARELLAAGILDQVPNDDMDFRDNFVPIKVQGRPVSEQIIEERR